MTVLEIAIWTILWLVKLIIVQRMPDKNSTRHSSRCTFPIMCPVQTLILLATSPLELPLMSKLPFYLLAIVCFVLSLLTGIAAQTKAARAAKFAAIAASSDSDDDQLVFLILSRRFLAEYNEVAITSLAILAAGAVAWFLSRRRRESGRQAILLVLMAMAVVIQLLLV